MLGTGLECSCLLLPEVGDRLSVLTTPSTAHYRLAPKNRLGVVCETSVPATWCLGHSHAVSGSNLVGSVPGPRRKEMPLGTESWATRVLLTENPPWRYRRAKCLPLKGIEGVEAAATVLTTARAGEAEPKPTEQVGGGGT